MGRRWAGLTRMLPKPRGWDPLVYSAATRALRPGDRLVPVATRGRLTIYHLERGAPLLLATRRARSCYATGQHRTD